MRTRHYATDPSPSLKEKYNWSSSQKFLNQNDKRNLKSPFLLVFHLHYSEPCEETTKAESGKTENQEQEQQKQQKQKNGNCLLLNEDENQNTMSAPHKEASSLLNEEDNIPLIDVQSSTEGNNLQLILKI